jgi:hypothetical protein
MDLQSLLGLGGQSNDPGGLLTPQQSGDINQTTMQGIAAGLLKASGQSQYKPGMTALCGLGDALQGGLAARRQAQSDALNQTLVRAKTLEGLAPMLKIQQDYAAVGLPLPQNYQRVIDSLTNITGGGRPGAAGAPGAPGATPTLSPTQSARLKAAAELGFTPYDLLKDSPGAETANKRIDDYLKNKAPDVREASEDAEIMKHDVESYGKQYAGIQGAGRLGAKTLSLADQIDAIRSLMKTSGYQPGGVIPPELSELLYKITGNRNAVTAMQLFPKLTAESLSGYLDMGAAEKAEMGSTSAGRQLLSTVNLFLKASPNLSMTDDAMGYLSDQLRRHSQEAVTIGDKAAEFKTKNKRLNSEWDMQLSKHMKDNPTYGASTLEQLGLGEKIPGSQAAAPAAAPTAMPPPPEGTKGIMKSPDGKQFVFVDKNGKPLGRPMPMPQAMGPAPIPQAGQ